MLEAEVRTAGPRPALSGHTHNTRLARYAWAVLAFNLPVVLLGAYVRATGSGAGCGKNWPLCNGEVAPHFPTAKTVIEFTHRATSGPIDMALVAVLLVWAFRTFPKRHPVRLGAVLSMVFLLTEALIGASLVLLGHVEKNVSITRAYSLSTHLLNTLTLLACLTLTAWWASGKPALRLRGREAWLAGISLAVVAILGVSGAIAALADTLFPAASLSAALRQDWDSASNIFLRLRGLHPVIALGAGVWLIFYATSSVSRRPEVRIQALVLGACVGAQILAGAMNLLLLAPIWMQLVHLLLADLLWISLVLLCASLLAVKAESAS